MHSVSWQPSASIETLRQRSLFIAKIREFFFQHGYLEVETPIMAHFGVTDVYLSSIRAQFRETFYYLQTSPEYHMKRLLAAGSGPIFQLARVFRDDELGNWHNPEFTLLEWYQVDIDHHGILKELDFLLQTLIQSKPLIKKTYQQVFEEILKIDPFNTPVEEFKNILAQYHLDNVLTKDEQDRDQYLFLLMSHVIEPALEKEKAPVAVYDFPATQASLARIKDNKAQRFEIYYKGVELANGFYELIDSSIQNKRFEKDKKKRLKKELPQVQADEFLLAALSNGLPECSGVALGVDRLLALYLQQDSIKKVMSFDLSRA